MPEIQRTYMLNTGKTNTKAQIEPVEELEIPEHTVLLELKLYSNLDLR